MNGRISTSLIVQSRLIGIPHHVCRLIACAQGKAKSAIHRGASHMSLNCTVVCALPQPQKLDFLFRSTEPQILAEKRVFFENLQSEIGFNRVFVSANV